MSSLINETVLGDKIEDAEEELFLLYCRRAGFHPPEKDVLSSIVVSEYSHDQGSQLGLVDQRHDTIDLQFSITNKETEPLVVMKKKKGTRRPKEKSVKTVEVRLAQDITGLRSRVGDTGGGVWRGSVLLAQALLEQLEATSKTNLFDQDRLAASRVLELGAGTGLLGLIVAPHVKSYMCTDLQDLIPLINKNVSLNRSLVPDFEERLTIGALDWNDVHKCPAPSRQRVFSHVSDEAKDTMESSTDPSSGFDLILAVDCVYNPSLIPPLLTTINQFATPRKSTAMIVMELRDEDVVREFLTQWMATAGWEIYRVGNDDRLSILDERFVIWIGKFSII